MTHKSCALVGSFLSFLLLIACTDKRGCMDPTASNYDPTATVEDGSCDFNPDGYHRANYSELFHKVYGGSGNNDDELASGMITDAAGNSYFSLNTNNAAANNNILIGRINADGSLAWAKEYDGNYDDTNPDSGENAETGGTANSISMDANGDIYVVGQTSDVSQNNIFSVLILKINPANGSLLWQKVWKHDWPTSGAPLGGMDARGYAVDATRDYVYVTGSTAANEIPLLALNKNDGSLFYEKAINLVAGTADKGYTLKSDANGNVFLGAISGAYAHFIKITAANTNNPTLDWVKKVDIGFAARFNAIDIDGSDIYLSCDRRGANSYFSIIKLDNNGTLQWGKSYPGLGDRNNAHCVKVVGSSLYAGGRTGQNSLDATYGDGLLLKMSKATGSLEWSGIYFTGKGSDELAEHRVKSIAVDGTDVIVAGQVYGGNGNTNHFVGSWITNNIGLTDYSPSISTITPASYGAPSGNSDLRTATGTYGDANSSYILQDASSKTTTSPPDGDFFITRLTLQ